MAGRSTVGRLPRKPKHRGARPRIIDVVAFRKTVKLPKSTGFELATVEAQYNNYRMIAKLVLTARPRTDNRAPGYHAVEVQEGQVTKQDVASGKLRRIAEHRLDALVSTLKKHRGMEHGLFLPKCNVTGKDDLVFLEETCSVCTSWYCELSPVYDWE